MSATKRSIFQIECRFKQLLNDDELSPENHYIRSLKLLILIARNFKILKHQKIKARNHQNQELGENTLLENYLLAFIAMTNEKKNNYPILNHKEKNLVSQELLAII